MHLDFMHARVDVIPVNFRNLSPNRVINGGQSPAKQWPMTICDNDRMWLIRAPFIVQFDLVGAVCEYRFTENWFVDATQIAQANLKYICANDALHH